MDNFTICMIVGIMLIGSETLICLYFRDRAKKLRQLQGEQSRKTQATIISAQCTHSQGMTRYTYGLEFRDEVGNKIKATHGTSNANFDNLNKGDSVSITYLSTAPRILVFTDHNDAENTLKSAGFLANIFTRYALPMSIGTILLLWIALTFSQ